MSARWILTLALAAASASPALAQPPAAAAPESTDQTQIPLGPVCLTNSCGGKAYVFNAEPKSVREAVEGGNAQAVRALGGAPTDAIAALSRRVEDQLAKATTPDMVESRQLLAGHFAAFADTSDGSTLSFSDNTNFEAPGRTVVGSITRTRPDGITQNVYLTADGGGIWVADGYDPNSTIRVPRG